MIKFHLMRLFFAFFVDVTEEVMETIRAAERAEAAYERKMYRYKHSILWIARMALKMRCY